MGRLTRSRTVALFVRDSDLTADPIVTELTARGTAVFRVDLGQFPQRLAVDARVDGTGRWEGYLATEHRRVELSDIRGIWYRRSSQFDFPGTLAPAHRAYADAEARFGLGGVLATLDAVWANHPNRSADAQYKPLQLSIARRCGLRIPSTLITNVPAAAASFAADLGPDAAVTKSLGANIVHSDDQARVAHTRPLRDLNPDTFAPVAATATQLQARVSKHEDWRVIVVGEQVFTIAIRTDDPAASIDWRANINALTLDWIWTPPELEKSLLRYAENLGMTYLAADFAVDQDGPCFLEANTAGIYGGFEARTGAPITAAIADLLTERSSR
ncbi:MvdC/MvdD family ATP grasp protein [Amycolatopsis sp. H20-H5]|uniref:MvdC/MvdD family ATP grasp protein n=1 Tax=Amycolatopsis sp. H20-H5 TaxID=3046309 RepID=UPI002DBF3607|nr:ATP-grasp ribosomal peptide maturase [Amycolatopsis sp. H20-H5]MEC3977750.1 ATP-grasp ribosomal peptide maturase [Amycolatopsis sp. H20-H5]